MRQRAILFGIIIFISITFFFAGYKLGLFLFSPDAELRGQQATQNYAEKNTELGGLTENSEVNVEENFCSDEIKFINEDDKKFCFQKSKLTEPRGIEVNLTNNKALLYDNGKLIKIFPLSYQSPENRWYEAPTGYYRVGVKHEKHLSSLFPVIMPYAVQFYEDFFIHGIPYYRDGKDVSSEFTGGCLRFNNDIAKEIYDFAKTGDQVVAYKTFDDLKIKEEFYPPVDLENFWIKQRFLNPYRQFRFFGGTSVLEKDYYQHTGVDLRPTTNNLQQSVYAIDNGKIAKIQINDGNDHGLGNTVIIEHHPSTGSGQVYSLYAHLASIRSGLKEGDIIKKGEIIGEAGNSGYGCQNYWRIGPDGCESQSPYDIHLHFEIKKAPVLENSEAGQVCQDKIDWPKRFCYGYVPDYPQKYGYLDPMEFLFEKKAN
ncbi:hypothetical protein COW77_01500 [Candidatus Wolfebacteria bacterium CG18_big_fil_WC_8_21_14_2_50_39_7]|uniref:L,D-TPase catalytic domain-containing protein n=5 Tax=Candidatus Wolfeibacteriota TaxID=1752735 RepID=A0A2M7Q7C8_9BACT|nr:peptidoglycan DD-metalloendopeptidase family protein [Parcubacteria group bacterium]NCO89553.1 peptidoglycan DD-metalloendopeptidase family protein [Candidatus Wolfebacteria bacterium]OIO65828.1 MAG: hypothetical protein AUJ30_00290 [Candidatus Wolfebacteria bacterium CG1_02_39_135]PIP92155.1 MAG: hypothetical protein COW77_01500 [Candidatus Wolfebacteria bacterium CG18_big_fil_WC_8_21_14_2_50_39_7]PIU98909.1 MAG: hypothetical protein COS60_00550 [Candidatus Wolfebacteria bacterium CG03_land